jgi:hypothetical protein
VCVPFSNWRDSNRSHAREKPGAMAMVRR